MVINPPFLHLSYIYLVTAKMVRKYPPCALLNVLKIYRSFFLPV